MYRRHGNKLGLLFLVCDLTVTALAWVSAYLLRFAVWPAPHGIPELRLALEALPLVLVLAAFSYRLAGLYEVHRLKKLPRELGVVCRAGGLLFLLAIATAFYRRDLYESRLAIGLFLLLDVLALAVVRRIIWRLLKYFRGRGLNYGRALIVGSGRTGQMVAKTIRDNAWTGLEAIGFVDRAGKIEQSVLPRLGEIDEAAEIIQRHSIDHVFVALPLSRYGELPDVYKALSDVLVEVQLVPDVPELAGVRLNMLQIDRAVFLSLRANPHHGWAKVAKRATDLLLGSAALLLALPLMTVLAVAVKLSSRGPVLYRQTRTGLGERNFEMFKFRTMSTDAERSSGPVWAVRNDGRCTPLGRFMRRWSLDELPQLFNVLAGDMSLVGPRPERGVFVEKFRKQIPGYAQRHQVKSGITGWAQVNGWRGNTSLRHRIQCDLYYIANWSLLLDLKILLLTFRHGLRHRNAY